MDKSVQNERAYQLSKALEYIKHHNKNFSWRKIQEIERKTVKEERRYVVQLMQSTLERVEANGREEGCGPDGGQLDRNTQILHAISQLIKINGQMLKLQSEAFRLEKKHGKSMRIVISTLIF